MARFGNVLLDWLLYCLFVCVRFVADKTSEQQAEEEHILQQLLEVVDMRDSLVLFLEEKRLKEISEEEEAFCMREAKRHSKTGAQVHWA